MTKINWGKNCINYWIASSATTSILNSAWTSECRLTLTLNFPNDLISCGSCIKEGLISILFVVKINFEISVGLTEPYSSLFSVLNFLTKYSFLLICSKIFFASFFFSWSFFPRSDLILLTCWTFSLEAYRAFFLIIK